MSPNSVDSKHGKMGT